MAAGTGQAVLTPHLGAPAAGATMRAAVCRAYGGPEVLRVERVAVPAPRPGELLVRVRASVATPPDCAFRSGRPLAVRFFTGLLRPKQAIIGGGFAGDVAAIGPEVSRFAVGDRVFGEVFGTGACAEYARVAQDGTATVMPDGMDYGEAAGLAEGGLTALPFLRDAAALQAGQRILVNGASGNVGTIAVQLAKHAGAEVVGVCSAANLQLVRSLGADRAIDYARENFADAHNAYDVIFDVAGNRSFGGCRRALKPGGLYMTTEMKVGTLLRMVQTSLLRNGRRARFVATGLRPATARRLDLEDLRTLAASGKVRGLVDRRYPLADIVAAHRYVETRRKRGSVVIDVAPPI